jgi:cytochrome c553
MTSKLPLIAFSIIALNCAAADLEAGKAKANAVCAACHGANGVSVAGYIPNLAGQRDNYMSAQLSAFKSGARKNDIMSAIAAQLSKEDIANVVAYFTSLPSASSSVNSSFLPNLVKTNVVIPANYKTGFSRYHAINEPDSKQIKIYYANDVAVAATKAGKSLPDGSAVFIEIYSAKLDANKKPMLGSDGFFIPDQLRAYTTMARDAGWGAEIPEILRNENWNYAIYSADRKLRTNINQAECLACHKPEAKSSYLFSYKELVAWSQAQAK